MSLNFLNTLTINGTSQDDAQLKFFDKNTFYINGSYAPTYQDVTVSGNDYVNLPNAKADGLNYLKLYGECELKDTELPLGYKRVTYIESSGTQYIDTGLKGSGTMSVEVDYSVNTDTTTTAIFGARVTSKVDDYLMSWYSTSNPLLYYSYGTNNTVTGAQSDHNRHIRKMTPTGCYYDGEKTDTWDSQTFETTNNCFLFKRSGADTGASAKVYSCKIWIGDTLTRNFIPCQNLSNVVGMYDTVTDTFFTNMGEGTFTAGAVVTPSPDNIMSLWCNNGELKARNTSGLPLGYTKVEYIHNEYTGGAGAYIELDLQPDGNSVFEIKCETTEGSAQFMVCRPVSGSLNYRIVKFSSGNKVGASIGSTNYSSNEGGSTPVVAKVDHKKVYVNGELIGDGSENQLSTYLSISLMRGYYSPTAIYYSTGKIYYAYVSVDGVNPSFNGIPAIRNYDNAAGLYDTVTHTFYPSNSSEKEFEAGAIDDSLEYYVDGTVETVKDSLNNTATAQNLLALSSIKDVQEVLTGAITRNIKAKILDGSESWSLVGSGSSAYFYLEGWATDSQVESTTPACMCSHYKGVTPRTTMGAAEVRVGTTGNSDPVVRHAIFLRDTSFTSTDDFKEYLGQQAINGTPVTIVYPLETATTESTTAQTLTTKKGSNTIEITQASITPLQIEANYKAGVSITITEIENANLDNSVTVTIS